MNVALATCTAMPVGFPLDGSLAGALAARGATVSYPAWDDRHEAWDRYGLVIVRSTFDYSRRREEFLAWADRLGDRVRNAPEILRWNSDKRYLADLRDDGLSVVPTEFVAPGDPVPALEGEIVIKPAVSAGARDTGRFSPSAHDAARHLVVDITASGRVAMVQPFLAAVEARGETALVHFAGELSHVLRKRSVLAADEVAPTRDDDIGAAEAMYEEDLVRAGTATDAERALAREILGAVERRFGRTPLYARVDLLEGDDGSPMLLELELVEPALYLTEAPGAAERLAHAILAG